MGITIKKSTSQQLSQQKSTNNKPDMSIHTKYIHKPTDPETEVLSFPQEEAKTKDRDRPRNRKVKLTITVKSKKQKKEKGETNV